MATSTTASRCIASSSRALSRPALVLPSPSRAYSTPAPQPPAQPNPDFSLPHIHLGATHIPRYKTHYDATLSTDILYMTYNHRQATSARAPSASPSTRIDPPAPVSPYELNRPTPLPRGKRPPRPSAPIINQTTRPKLESIVIHTMVKDAIANKQNLLAAIMALRAISGESANGGGRSGSTGVQVIASRSGAAAFKLRAGMPVATKVELRGDAMYDFLQSLVDFVLPRLREFPGFVLPLASASKTSPSAVAGVVSMGLPPAAMGLFPQIEGNLDAYPRMHGFHMHFKTNQRGERALENAQALLSGFKIPFYRR